MATTKPQPVKPPAQSAPTIRTRHLETVRNGNDNYTTTEYSLEGDGKTWKTVETKAIAEKKSRSVTLDYVRDWWLQRVGRNGLGDFD